MSKIINITKLFPLTSDNFDIDVNKKHQTEITVFSDVTDDSLILTVELLKENDIIQDVLITKAKYWYEDTHTSSEITITKYLQNLADNIIKKYDETAFTDYEPQYKSDYDMYGVLEQDFH